MSSDKYAKVWKNYVPYIVITYFEECFELLTAYSNASGYIDRVFIYHVLATVLF